MSHRDYIADRARREPRFTAERQAAAAELALGDALVRRRHESHLTLSQLAEETGIPEERLEAIEEGESMTFHEVLWLLHALDISLSIEPDFSLAPRASAISRHSAS
jgi:transcriptional regulator with XRE-family HTH domain